MSGMGKKNIVAGIAITIISMIVVFGCYSYYIRYRNTVIKSESRQLQTMADTVARDLSNYITSNLNEIDLFYDEILPGQGNRDRLDGIVSAYLKSNGNLYSGLSIREGENAPLYYDGSGIRTFEENTTEALVRWTEKAEADQEKYLADHPIDAAGHPELTVSQDAQIIGKELDKDNSEFHMYILKRRYEGGKWYNIVLSMNLTEIYHRIVEPVRIGDGGYSIVKDQDRTIIMHHAASQIGLDAYTDRTKLYKGLNLDELGAWTVYQQRHDYGSQVLHTYNWDEAEPQAITRLVAFTAIDLRGERWIVNSTLPLEELSRPLTNMVVMLITILIIYFAIVVTAALLVSRILYRSEAQSQRIHYLQEINRGMELIMQKNEEIRHYQRIQSLGMMSSHIAHEFNNYLTPVLLYADMLKGDETLSDDGRKMVDEITDSIDRAASLSKQLLEFSRQDTGMCLEAVNLTEEIRSACEMIRQLCPAKIQFASSITQEPIRALARKGMMEQIMMNLSKNAFQAMEDSEVRKLRVNFGRNADGIPALSVEDTGCGIAEQSLQRIFEPFYTTRGSREGTGLGLSVIQNIMNSLGGQITVESAPGHGTTFTLTFPEVDRTQKNSGRKRLESIRNVAIVSPDPEIRQMKRYLSHYVEDVVTFDHAAPVIDRIQENAHRFELLIADYNLPAMRGIDLAEIARRINPEMRVVILVDHMDNDLRWFTNNGIIDRFILKNELERELKNLPHKNAGN